MMPDLDIIKECRQTGRTRTTTKKLLEKAYYEQMTKEIDISTVGQHAKVLIEGDTVTIMGEKYKRVEEPEVLKTLYDALQLPYFTNGYHFNEGQKDWICDIVKEWLSQFHPDDMSFENLSYSNAFFDALDLVRKTLR
jgi:peptidase E